MLVLCGLYFFAFLYAAVSQRLLIKEDVLGKLAETLRKNAVFCSVDVVFGDLDKTNYGLKKKTNNY